SGRRRLSPKAAPMPWFLPRFDPLLTALAAPRPAKPGRPTSVGQPGAIVLIRMYKYRESRIIDRSITGGPGPRPLQGPAIQGPAIQGPAMEETRMKPAVLRGLALAAGVAALATTGSASAEIVMKASHQFPGGK